MGGGDVGGVSYAIQDRWLAQFGALESEFDLNRRALVPLTRCGLH